MLEAAKQFGALEEQPTPAPQPAPMPMYPDAPAEPQRHWLRPPGAVVDQQFRDLCSRCGECLRVCPAQCIRMDYAGLEGDGVPYIDPDTMPCTVCEGIMCSNYCPTGALIPTTRETLNIGLAVWSDPYCLRTTGQPCTTCIDKCPIGESAIRLTEGKIEVSSAGCVGCGTCQHECPTMPKSISVMAKAAMMK